MDHAQHAMAVTAADLHSTFEGHVLPGSMFILWALMWMGQRLAQGDDIARARTLESTLYIPVLKIVLPLIGVWVEIPGDWDIQSRLMSLQHVTMYSAFALTGVVDLLAYRNLLPAAATYIAFAAAQFNAGFLFWGHAIHGGVDGVVHRILASAFFVVAALAVSEAVRPSVGRGWLRIGAQLVLGGWFILGGWVLYLSGWELNNPVNEGRSSMHFSWLVIGVSILVIGARVLAGMRTAVPGDARVG
jgi:hypothetical protein